VEPNIFRCPSGAEGAHLRVVSRSVYRVLAHRLETFGVEVVLNRRLALERVKRFEFLEKKPERVFESEPGLEEFLRDASLSGDTTQWEIVFLKSLRFNGLRPAALYCYLETKPQRLHFHSDSKSVTMTRFRALDVGPIDYRPVPLVRTMPAVCNAGEYAANFKIELGLARRAN
jgi:hypothetical protein